MSKSVAYSFGGCPGSKVEEVRIIFKIFGVSLSASVMNENQHVVIVTRHSTCNALSFANSSLSKFEENKRLMVSYQALWIYPIMPKTVLMVNREPFKNEQERDHK